MSSFDPILSQRNKTTTKSKNNHDPHWDPTRDHGEAQARQAMERYGVGSPTPG